MTSEGRVLPPVIKPEWLQQVGWLGPYGLIPGGMDNDPAPHWQPVYRVTTPAKGMS